MDNLKPCPFCGEQNINIADNEWVVGRIDGTGGWYAQCSNCLAKFTNRWDKKHAIDSWNRRVEYDD